MNLLCTHLERIQDRQPARQSIGSPVGRLSHKSVACEHIDPMKDLALHPEISQRGSYLLVVEIPRAVSLIQPGMELAHVESKLN